MLSSARTSKVKDSITVWFRKRSKESVNPDMVKIMLFSAIDGK